MISVLCKNTIRSVSRDIAIWTILHVYRKSRGKSWYRATTVRCRLFIELARFIPFTTMTRVRFFTFIPTLSEFPRMKKSFTLSTDFTNECLRNLTRSFFFNSFFSAAFLAFMKNCDDTANSNFISATVVRWKNSVLIFVFAQTGSTLDRSLGRDTRLNRNNTRIFFIVKIMLQLFNDVYPCVFQFVKNVSITKYDKFLLKKYLIL